MLSASLNLECKISQTTVTSKTLPAVGLQKLGCRAAGRHAWLHVSVALVSLRVCEPDRPLCMLCDPVGTVAVWRGVPVRARGLVCFLGVFTTVSDPQRDSYYASHLASLGEVRPTVSGEGRGAPNKPARCQAGHSCVLRGDRERGKAKSTLDTCDSYTVWPATGQTPMPPSLPPLWEITRISAWIFLPTLFLKTEKGGHRFYWSSGPVHPLFAEGWSFVCSASGSFVKFKLPLL